MALLECWVEIPENSHFPIQNLPYGIFKSLSHHSIAPRPATAIGNFVLDLNELTQAGLFDGPLLNKSDCFLQPCLNKFIAMGRPAWKEARATIERLLSSEVPTLRDNEALRKKCLLPMSEVEMILPIEVGNYSDFCSSKHHMFNCGCIFFKPENAIPPNWHHLPIAYHGRASSIVVSGTEINRPRGQSQSTVNSTPNFAPCSKLDFELEMAAVVGTGNELGKRIDISEVRNHIFGLVLMNDWSARDIQAWEFVPLGPFSSKSFGTSISPWIVTLEALEPFTCSPPQQDPRPLPYLIERNPTHYDIHLEVRIRPAGSDVESIVTRSNFKNLYWTIGQQVAHHTVNGCNLKAGDLLGTGTISGVEPESMACMFELTWNGQKPIILNDVSRAFLEDGDEVILTGVAKGNGYNVGFGNCSGKIVPS